VFLADGEQPSERSDAGLLVVGEVAGFVKGVVRSEAEAGAASGERGAAPCPASAR
jgi:hypothetical protein